MKKFAISLLAFSFWLLAFPDSAFAATLSLSPSSGTFNKSCNFSLDVVVDTAGTETDGTDVIIFYDSSRFTAQTITNGTIYPDFPGNNIDSQSGKITISGLASVSTPFSGKGTLATINLSVKDTAPEGANQITFDFDPNNKAKTTDSNVVQRGTVVDILNSVTPGNYTIGTGTCGATVTTLPKTGGQGAVSTPSAQPIQQPIQQPIPVKTLPPAGSQELTFTLAIVGSVLTILGILGLALL